MNEAKGWHRLTTATLPAAVTIQDLTTTTGLSRRAVRELIADAMIIPLPGCGPHGALSYDLQAILTAVANRPGKGNRRSTRPPELNAERHAFVLINGEPYIVHNIVNAAIL